jgi:protein-L-isoaspartate(D-aspartate) O-methyltransferase
MTLDECRRFYAEEIRFVANLESAAVVEAFGRVPREKFLGPPPWQIALPKILSGDTIYRSINDPRDLCHNVLIAIDPARGLNNGQPSALASWIEALDLRPGDRVFHVGCGVGYYTAIMAELVGAGGSAIACDVDSELAARAAANLDSYPNVVVHPGDGAAFDPGPCDAIFINAGVTHPHLPWLDLLKEGGRLVFPLTFAMGEKGSGIGRMLKITHRQGRFAAEAGSEVGIYLCTSVRDPQMEPPIKKGLATGTLLKLKSARRNSHEQTDSCIVHREDVCLSTLEPAGD